MPPIIQTERLTKAYGVHRGISEVDLEVNAGEVFGFLGPNGAGKTTTIRILLDLIRPTSGRRAVFGIVSSQDPVAIHARIGYLPGEFTLYDRLTGAETIEYFANLRGGFDRAYSGQLVERLGLDTSRRFREYSRGQQAEGRPDLRPPAPAGAADPGRADRGPRSARPADVQRAALRGQGRGPDRLPLLAHHQRGRAHLRPGRDHPRRPDRPARHGRIPS